MYEIRLGFGELESDETGKRGDAGNTELSRFRVCQNFDDACFDFNFPFRPLLEFVRDCIETSGTSVELVLPDYYEHEDFVEGRLGLTGRDVWVYFEHSLAYLSFSSYDRQDLNLLKEMTEGKQFRHIGYGLADGQW